MEFSVKSYGKRNAKLAFFLRARSIIQEVHWITMILKKKELT